MNLAPGAIFGGRYRVGETLGRGGAGVVVEAVRLSTGTTVALKVLNAEAVHSAAQLERFRREVRALSEVKSDHVVRVEESGVSDPEGRPYLVMERLVGVDLGGLVRGRGPVPPAETARYVEQAARALIDVHARGIVHRDVKLSNLFLIETGDASTKIKLLDFGISKLDETMADTTVTAPTATGDAVGTPHYMSPEQIRDPRSVDARTDVWALGVVLYRLLTGSYPFTAASAPGVFVAIAHDPTPSPSQVRPEIPAAIDALCTRCLAKRPEERPTLQEIVDVLSASRVSKSTSVSAPPLPARSTPASARAPRARQLLVLIGLVAVTAIAMGLARSETFGAKTAVPTSASADVSETQRVLAPVAETVPMNQPEPVSRAAASAGASTATSARPPTPSPRSLRPKPEKRPRVDPYSERQ